MQTTFVFNWIPIGILYLFMSNVSCVPSVFTSPTRQVYNTQSNATQDIFSANYIVTALDYLMQDCLAFQKALQSSSFGLSTRSTTVMLRFSLLTSQNCNSFQLTERLQAYTGALSRVSVPLSLILKQLPQGDDAKAIIHSLVKVKSSYQTVYTKLIQMTEKLLCNDVKTQGPSLAELDATTIKYLRSNHPATHLTGQNIHAFRNYAFMQSLKETARTIKSELQKTLFI